METSTLEKFDKDESENIFLKLLSYPRVFVLYAFILIYTIVSSIGLVVGAWFKAGVPYQQFFLQTWNRFVLWGFNVHVQVSGLENLKEENGIIIFKHSSHFDIPILVKCLPKVLRFGAKIELFKIPFFGSAMRNAGMLPITRSNRKKVLEIYKKAAENIHSMGVNYVLAPEGTRCSGEAIGEFKSGPFIFGIYGQVPLYPVLIKGAHKVMPKHALFPHWGRWRSDVKLKVLPPISTQGYKDEDWPKLKDYARSVMEEEFHKM